MSPPYSNNDVEVIQTLLMYGSEDCNAEYSRTIEQVLSDHLKRRVVTRIERFDYTKKRWIYSVWLDDGGLLEPIEVSENVRRVLRRLVTNTYQRQVIPFDQNLKNGGFNLIERRFLDQGGLIAYTFYTNIPRFNSDPQIQHAISYYWIIQGWAEAATIMDNSVRPPILHPDETITIYVRKTELIHHFMRIIKKSLRQNRETGVEYYYLDTPKKMVVFRAQEGSPLIIGDIGIKRPSNRIPASEVKRRYLEWLYPCIGDEDLSWTEFGRIIKDNGDCYALEETPENSLRITFMQVARVLSVAGIYPLGPFRGLLPWPYHIPDVVNDFKILGYDQPELQLLQL